VSDRGSPLLLRLHTVLAVFRSAVGNPTLRRVGAAYALFSTAEFGIWITLLVFAYGHGGATAGMVMVLVQLVPCIVVGPFIGALADRRRPSRMLRTGYGLQAVTMAGVALAVGVGAPPVAIFALAPLTALSLTVTRPPQAALLPAVVHTPDELTAANVMGGWTDGAAALVGPALVGVLLAWQGAGAAVLSTAALSALALALVVGVRGPEAAVGPAAAPEPAGAEGPEDPGTGRGVRSLVGPVWQGTRANIDLALSHPQIRVLLTLHTFSFVLIGALDLLCVVLATDVLRMGAGGAGFLNAALGAGALLAGFVTAFLIGRRRLAATLTVSLAAAVVALAAVATTHAVVLVLVLVAGVGLAVAVFDVTGRTLLQRSAPSDAIAGSFAILEALMDLGLALGAVLVRAAIALGGIDAALVAPAVMAAVLVACLWRQLHRIDGAATVPQVEIQLLRSIPLFAALPAPALEGVARELEPVTVPAGSVVIREGDPGDCYYAVAEGRLDVTRDGRAVQRVTRGDGFGEIALIRDVPRQATVTASTDGLLYRLRKELFVSTVTGHAAAAAATRSVIDRHLDGRDRPPPD
jgi:predicted MFS family arabinose efflux permease